MKIKVASDQISVKAIIEHLRRIDPRMTPGSGYRAWIEGMVRQRWDSGVNWTVQGEAVQAWVNHSNWVGSCRFCAGEIVVEPGEPYFCPDCAMQGNGFKACPVLWPVERTEIERLLLKRDDPNTRNWLISESVADLRRENAEHGVNE